jgi:hypothetical protein
VIVAEQSQPFEAVLEAGETGLLATLQVAVQDNDGNVVIGPLSTNLTELSVGGTPTGTYVWNAPAAPAAEGQYSVIWSTDGTFDPDTITVEDLVIGPVSFSFPALGAEVADSIICSAWTTAEDVVDCCSAEIGSDTSRLEASIIAASEVLYLASGKQYPGVCTRTVRPCRTDTCSCGDQVLSRGHLISWDGSCWGGYDCGCQPTSMVKLAGRVRSITSVKIDGVTLDTSGYFVQDGRWLIRRSPDRWPRCQTIGLPDTEEGTWSVTYTYGKAPPVMGQLAAQELACEVVKACTPGVACALPSGVVRQVREGITIERSLFVLDENGRWATGLGQVDLFLNAVNPNGIRRRGVVWSAASRGRYARPNPV